MDPARIPFSPDDEAKIASAANWGSIMAITSIVGGGLSLIITSMAASKLGDGAEMFAMVPAIIAEAFVLVINVWLLQACQAFRKVAVTDVADQAYLLAGFRKLRAYFLLQVVMILAMFGLAFFGGAMAAAMR